MSLTAGQVVGGHYEVVARLGGGGFGETYLSKDLHLPDRPTRVIKRLCPRVQSISVLQLSRRLFETEAQVLYRLGTHPQIPQLFAHFEELSEFYLVQEYIDGKDLSYELLHGKIWEQFAVVNLLQNLLTVLSFVHKNKVIHRDIKPENIIRRVDGQLFLIDFGIVKQIATATTTASGQAVEQTGYTVGIGTPGYMPSEQAHGEPKFASDIYAIGIIGIQALTGLPPSHLAKDENLEILWREYAPKVYPEFADILSRMVKFDFRQRYSRAEEASDAIREFADRYPVSTIKRGLPLPPPPLPPVLINSNTNQTAKQLQDKIEESASDRKFDQKQNKLTQSKVWQYVQPWYFGLGIFTLGAIAITALILTLGAPTRSARTNIADEVKETVSENLSQNNNISQNPLPDSSTNSIRSSNTGLSLVKEFSTNNGNDEVYGVTISPDNKTVAGASSERNIELWDLQTNKKLQTLKGHTGRVYDVYFSPDGQKLVSASDDRKVIIWNIKTGKILNTLVGHQDRVYTSIFSPDGRMIASSSADRTIRLWDAETGKPISTLSEKSWVYDVSFTPDSKVLASGSKEGAIRLWNIETGKVIKTLLENGSSVRSLTYSNDGKLIASAMEDRTVRLWDTTTGQLKEIFTGHTDEVHTIAFSSDDRLLASGSADKTIRIWHLKEKRSPQILSDYERGIASVEFSSDRKLLISGSLDGKVKIWKFAN